MRNPLSVLAVVLLVTGFQPMEAQSSGEKVIVSSGEAKALNELVRSRTSGVITHLFVTEGQEVRKGQVLGHTYLDDIQYKLDLARLTLKNNASLRALEAQADAWSVTREETKEAVRKRDLSDTRLDWAMHMERFHRSNYEARLEQQEINRLNVDYWEKQYENCFFTAPADGVVTALRKTIGDPVDIATPVCTIINRDSFLIPVPVTPDLANLVTIGTHLPVRTSHGKLRAHGKVEKIESDPSKPEQKIIHLLLGPEALASTTLSDVEGLTFDVLLSQGPSARAGSRRSL